MEVLTTVVIVVVFIVGTLFVGYFVYPLIGPMFTRPGSEGFTLALIFGLLIATIGSLAGLHLIIGAYLGGLFIREEIMDTSYSFQAFHLGTFSDLVRRFRMLSHGFLGPFFILSVAFKAELSIIWAMPLFLLLFIAAATFGKLLGAGGGAYVSGSNKNESFVIGMSMNGRGTVGLILMNIGLSAGILTEEHLSLLVFTAFATTLMVPVVIKYVFKKHIDSESFERIEY